MNEDNQENQLRFHNPSLPKPLADLWNTKTIALILPCGKALFWIFNLQSGLHCLFQNNCQKEVAIEKNPFKFKTMQLNTCSVLKTPDRITIFRVHISSAFFCAIRAVR